MHTPINFSHLNNFGNIDNLSESKKVYYDLGSHNNQEIANLQNAYNNARTFWDQHRRVIVAGLVPASLLSEWRTVNSPDNETGSIQ